MLQQIMTMMGLQLQSKSFSHRRMQKTALTLPKRHSKSDPPPMMDCISFQFIWDGA